MVASAHKPSAHKPGNRNITCRMLQIERLIKSGGRYGLKELAGFFGVSERTIQRDLSAMRTILGAPLGYDRLRGSFYYRREFSLPRPDFSKGELVALFMTEKLLSSFEGTPYAAALSSAAAKIRVLLTDGGPEPAGEADFISVACDPLRGDELKVAEHFAVLERARRDGRRVELVYHSMRRDGSTRRPVDPYHLYMWRGAWYLVGFCHLRNEVRIFALDRMETVRETGAGFTIPDDFRIEDYLKNSWGIERGAPARVKIRFDAYQAKWIRERTWHGSQRITELPDGGLIFEVVVGGLREIKEWVMGFGAHAEALEPEELRKEIREEVRRMDEMYREKTLV